MWCACLQNVSSFIYSMLMALKMKKMTKRCFLCTLWFKTGIYIKYKVDSKFSLEIQAKRKIKMNFWQKISSGLFRSYCPNSYSRLQETRYFAQSVGSYYKRDRRWCLRTWNVWKNFTTVCVITYYIMSKEFTQNWRHSWRQNTSMVSCSCSVHMANESWSVCVSPSSKTCGSSV